MFYSYKVLQTSFIGTLTYNEIIERVSNFPFYGSILKVSSSNLFVFAIFSIMIGTFRDEYMCRPYSDGKILVSTSHRLSLSYIMKHGQ